MVIFLQGKSKKGKIGKKAERLFSLISLWEKEKEKTSFPLTERGKEKDKKKKGEKGKRL